MRGDDPEFDAWVDRARAGSFLQAIELCEFMPAKGQAQRNDRAGPCPACGGTDRFAVRFNDRVFNCRHCGARGRDALSLALVGEKISFVEACEALTGEPKPSHTRDETPEERAARHERRRKAEAAALVAAEKQARQIEADRRRSLESADRLWGRGGSLVNSPIADYFGHRDIRPLPPGIENLRFVSDLPYYVEVDVERGGDIETELRVIHRGPGMLGRIQAPAGRIIGVHRTWFDQIFSADNPKGRPHLFHPQTGKALKTKKVLGEQHGGAIRLVRGLDWRGNVPTGFPGDMIPPTRMFLAEGVETLLSVYLALWRDRSPLLDRAAFWCGINLGNLQNIRAPKPIAEVILLGDGDSDPDDTTKALGRAEASFTGQGCRVARLMADRGKDFNDMLRAS
ncbi:MAG: cell Division and Cell Cycle [Proteobacteria bacterium]|nr:cell Division and Cell Cycle [Pseudomonadota bacterium]